MAKSKDYTKFSEENEEVTTPEVVEETPEPQEPQEPQEPTGPQHGDICTVVKCSSLNIRQKPMLEARVVTIVPAGTKLFVEAVVGAWTRVHMVSDNTRRGFVMNEYIEMD
jgi:uncharacterized protein YgiM (DUF1202 family)